MPAAIEEDLTMAGRVVFEKHHEKRWRVSTSLNGNNAPAFVSPRGRQCAPGESL
jgi:hypothetical protein